MVQVKICPSCGLENPLSETMCMRCMADISRVSPVDPESDAVLVLVGSSGSLKLKDGAVIGRESEGREVLGAFPTVSRVHARVSFSGTWSVEDMHSTNGTWVNGRRLKAGEKCSLKSGDSVSLSKSCAFTVQ